MAKSELTDKQEMFVAEYLIDFNATRAAKAAGYKPRAAQQMGAENLLKPVIAKAIAIGKAKQLEKSAFTAEEVIEGFARIARQDPRKLFRDGKLIPIPDLDDDTALTISGLDFVTVGEGDAAVAHVSKIKQDDRTASLKALAAHFGVAVPKMTLLGDADAPLTVDATERAARVAALLAKAVAASKG